MTNHGGRLRPDMEFFEIGEHGVLKVDGHVSNRVDHIKSPITDPGTVLCLLVGISKLELELQRIRCPEISYRVSDLSPANIGPGIRLNMPECESVGEFFTRAAGIKADQRPMVITRIRSYW